MGWKTKEEELAYRKEYYRRNKEKIKARSAQTRAEKPQEVSEGKKRWYAKNRAYVIKKVSEYASENLDKIKPRKEDWYFNRGGKEKASLSAKRRRPLINAAKLKRYYFDPKYKFVERHRNVAHRAIVYGAKQERYISLLGATIKEVRDHLESQFKTGMTWENYGEWEIDHKIPLSSISLENTEQVLLVCNYQNLQPLWKLENLRKGSKILEEKK